MNSDFADRERIIRYSASILSCRIGPLRWPQVCVACLCIQLTRREEFHVAMLHKDIEISIA